MNPDLWVVMVYLIIFGIIISLMGIIRYGNKISLLGFIVSSIGILIGLISFYV